MLRGIFNDPERYQRRLQRRMLIEDFVGGIGPQPFQDFQSIDFGQFEVEEEQSRAVFDPAAGVALRQIGDAPIRIEKTGRA